MSTENHINSFLMPIEPVNGFLSFGQMLTKELHSNTESKIAMETLLANVCKTKLDDPDMKSYKSKAPLKLNLPDVEDESIAAMLVVLYLKAKDHLGRHHFPADRLPAHIASASKGIKDLLAKEPDFPKGLLKETLERSAKQPKFSARIQAGAKELRELVPSLRALGNNPWELACIIGGFTMAIWICIAIGIALVIIYVSDK
jgi:hypothetical protein